MVAFGKMGTVFLAGWHPVHGKAFTGFNQTDEIPHFDYSLCAQQVGIAKSWRRRCMDLNLLSLSKSRFFVHDWSYRYTGRTKLYPLQPAWGEQLYQPPREN